MTHSTSRVLDSERRHVVKALQEARNVLAITGAGVSAESGIPTFRGEGGWWRSHNAQDLATFNAFQHDPKTVWEWYEYRRELIARSQPNAAHRLLAFLEERGKKVFIITQNVDDLHERAGSRQVVHIHGSIWSVICLNEHRCYEDRRVPLPQIPPFCSCGGSLRPGVVWFGEALPATACVQVADYFSHEKTDVALVIGTEATFGYIGEWALAAKRSGALLVEINLTETVLSPCADVRLEEKAGEILGLIQGNM